MLHHDYAMALYQTNHKADAEKELREAIRLKDDYALAHYQLGLILAERNALKPAEAAFKNAVLADPKMVDAFTSLGLLLKAQRRTEEALDVFESARALYAAQHDTNQLARIDKLFEELQPQKPATP